MTTIRVTLLRDGDLRLGGAELIDEWKSGGGVRMWVDIGDPRQESSSHCWRRASDSTSWPPKTRCP